MSSEKKRANTRIQSKRLSAKKLRQALKKIKLLLMDVDGTLTDGSITMLEGGARTARFSVRDGYGLMLLRHHGIRLGFITGSNHWYVDERAKSLKIDYVVKNTLQKVAAYRQIQTAAGVRDEEVAYIGDDYPDAELFPYIGVAIAVADAMDSVKTRAHAVTLQKGGQGAVREVVEWIREAQGIPETITDATKAAQEYPLAAQTKAI